MSSWWRIWKHVSTFFATGGWSIGLFYFESELRLFLPLAPGQSTCPHWPRKSNSGLIDRMALPRGQTLERWCLCWHFKPSFHNLMTELLEVLKNYVLSRLYHQFKAFLGPLKHGLMANKPNCKHSPIGHVFRPYNWWKRHEFGKRTFFLFFPPPPLPFFFFYPSQYGDIISLTVSTQVHLVIHIIKETKTTDVFLNLEVCIKTCLLLCMFLCCREVEKKMSSLTTVFWADLKKT